MNETECLVELQKVLLAPDMIYDLISRSKARRSGYITPIDDSEKEPTKKSLKLIEKRPRKNIVVVFESAERLYEANIKPLSMDKCCVTQTDRSNLCHNRFAHVSSNILNQTLPNCLTVTISIILENPPSCKACKLGKSVRRPRFSRNNTATNVLSSRPIERNFIDLVVPTKTAPLGGSRHFFTMSDEHSGYSV